MGPAEIVASLKDSCREGSTIRHRGDRGLDRTDRRLRELSRARPVCQEDESAAVRPHARIRGRPVGPRIKRLWSSYDPKQARRYYVDLLEMPDADARVSSLSMPGSSSSFEPFAKRWPTMSPASGSSRSIREIRKSTSGKRMSRRRQLRPHRRRTFQNRSEPSSQAVTICWPRDQTGDRNGDAVSSCLGGRPSGRAYARGPAVAPSDRPRRRCRKGDSAPRCSAAGSAPRHSAAC